MKEKEQGRKGSTEVSQLWAPEDTLTLGPDSNTDPTHRDFPEKHSRERAWASPRTPKYPAAEELNWPHYKKGQKRKTKSFFEIPTATHPWTSIIFTTRALA